MANHFNILTLRTQEQDEKAKTHDTRRRAPQVVRCPIHYWRRGEKWLQKVSQSRNDAQLWVCLVVKAKTDAVKNNIA